VICLTVVLKLALKVCFRLYCIFKHCDRNDLIFFGHFENVSMTEKNSFWFYDHFSEFYYDFLTRSVSYKWYNDKFNNVYCTFSASFLVIIEAIHPFAGLHTPHIPIKAKRSTYGYKLPNLLLKVKDPSSDKAVLAAVRHESSPNDVTADKAGGKLGESGESFDKVSAC